MKLIKIDKNLSVQQYIYQCIKCNKIATFRQDTHQTTELCHNCFLKCNKPRAGTSKYNISAYNNNASKIRRAIYKKKLKEKERVCKYCGISYHSCSEESQNICTRCSKITRKKLKSNTSGYIGVGYIKPRIRKNGSFEQGYFYGRMIYKGIRIFNVEYKDSYEGSDEYKILKCAIDREIHILEKGLNYTRNFTDDEIKMYVKNGIKC